MSDVDSKLETLQSLFDENSDVAFNLMSILKRNNFNLDMAIEDCLEGREKLTHTHKWQLPDDFLVLRSFERVREIEKWDSQVALGLQNELFQLEIRRPLHLEESTPSNSVNTVNNIVVKGIQGLGLGLKEKIESMTQCFSNRKLSDSFESTNYSIINSGDHSPGVHSPFNR